MAGRIAITRIAGLLLALAAAPVEAAPEESERDVDAVLPTNSPPKDARLHGVLVVDETTGLPVPGARLRHYTEMTGIRAHHLQTVRCDANGFAVVDVTKWDGDGHWLADAPGYAATHEYGRTPPDRIEVVRGRRLALRLLDGTGRPLAGVPVEAFDGCGHAPTYATAVTDANGRFAFERVGLSRVLLWAVAEGAAADYREIHDDVVWAGGEACVVLGPGVVAEGVVTDAEGTPLPGVTVQSLQAKRGPVMFTGSDGRFRLVGVEPGSSLEFWHPLVEYEGAGRRTLGDDEWTPGVPLRVAVSPWGIVESEEPRRTVRVRTAAADGVPAPLVSLRFVRRQDGSSFHTWTDYDPPVKDGTDVGEATEDLPPGQYDVVPDDPFDEWTFAPTTLAIEAGVDEIALRLVVARRPTLRVQGDVPEDAKAVLVAGGHEKDVSRAKDGEWEGLPVPAEGPATLRVTYEDGVWFFPVESADEGVRRVLIAIPRPHRIRIPGAAEAEIALEVEGVPASLTRDGATFATYACGVGTLAMRRAYADVTLSRDRPSDIEVAGADTAHDSVVRFQDEEGKPLTDVRAAALDDTGREVLPRTTWGSEMRVAFPRPLTFVAEREGFVPARLRVEGPGTFVVRWAAAEAVFVVLDPDGKPLDAVVFAAGESFDSEDPNVPIRVRGLSAGLATFVVLPRDPKFLGKEVRLALAQGETRSRTVVLSSR